MDKAKDFEKGWEDVQIDGQIFIECVDEVAKKITESRDEFHSRDN